MTDGPDPRRFPRAYLPDVGTADTSGDLTSIPRAELRRRAREQRLEDRGLPVDDATLERVVDAVLDPEFPYPGPFLTFEEARDDVEEDVTSAVDLYLDRHPEVDGGRRWGWRAGLRVFVAQLAGDRDGSHEAALRAIDDRVEVEHVPRREAELKALAERIVDDHDALSAAGWRWLEVSPDTDDGKVDVQVVGPAGAEAAEAYFGAAYGDAVRVTWLGPTDEREVPHPFGSWTADGRTVRVFFWMDHNGERPGHATVLRQSAEAVTIALTRFEPRGLHTLIGGFSPQHADVGLDGPLRDRTVVDASTGAARPCAADVPPGPEAF